MKVRCDIDGIDCPHCALELQTLIAKHDAISDANINFPLKSLVVEVSDDSDEEEILEIVQGIANKFDSNVCVELRD